MTWKKFHKELLGLLKKLSPQINEGMELGIPHIVGEIRRAGESIEIDLSVVVFQDSRHRFFISDGDSDYFMYPADTSDPNLLFFELLMFLRGYNSAEAGFELAFRTDPARILRNLGLDVLWRSEYPVGEGYGIQLWVGRKNIAYNMLFEETEGGFILRDMKKIRTQ
jgi:hypothetical protein